MTYPFPCQNRKRVYLEHPALPNPKRAKVENFQEKLNNDLIQIILRMTYQTASHSQKQLTSFIFISKKWRDWVEKEEVVHLLNNFQTDIKSIPLLRGQNIKKINLKTTFNYLRYFCGVISIENLKNILFKNEEMVIEGQERFCLKKLTSLNFSDIKRISQKKLATLSLFETVNQAKEGDVDLAPSTLSRFTNLTSLSINTHRSYFFLKNLPKLENLNISLTKANYPITIELHEFPSIRTFKLQSEIKRPFNTNSNFVFSTIQKIHYINVNLCDRTFYYFPNLQQIILDSVSQFNDESLSELKDLKRLTLLQCKLDNLSLYLPHVEYLHITTPHLKNLSMITPKLTTLKMNCTGLEHLKFNCDHLQAVYIEKMEEFTKELNCKVFPYVATDEELI